MKKYQPDTGQDLFASFEEVEYKLDAAAVTPITLDFCGSEQCSPGHCYGPDGPVIRTVYILHFILGGCGYLEKGGRNFPLEEGQAFLIYPGELNYYQADMENPWRYIWIGFHGLQAENMMERAGFTREAPFIALHRTNEICAYMKDIMENSELTYVKELKRMSSLLGLLSVLCSENEQPDTPAGREKALSDRAASPARNQGRGLARAKTQDAGFDYVQTAVNLLTSAEKTRIRVEDVAKHIGVSRNYLDSLFKQKLGISPKEYLMNFRMEKASALLANTDNPVGVIAAEVGYADPMTFSKIFRRRFGMCPTEFRESRYGERKHKNNII